VASILSLHSVRKRDTKKGYCNVRVDEALARPTELKGETHEKDLTRYGVGNRHHWFKP
jgi:hypothetical protein